jgi:hypothetical protein
MHDAACPFASVSFNLVSFSNILSIHYGQHNQRTLPSDRQCTAVEAPAIIYLFQGVSRGIGYEATLDDLRVYKRSLGNPPYKFDLGT